MEDADQIAGEGAEPEEELVAFLAGCPAFTGVEVAALRALATGVRSWHPPGGAPADLAPGEPILVRDGALLVRNGAGRTIDLLGRRDFHSPAEGERVEPLEPARVLVLPDAATDLAWSASPAQLRSLRAPAPPAEDPQTAPVRTIMSAPVVTADGEESCQSVAARMREHRVSSVVVRTGDQTGIVTDRDLCNRLVAEGGSPQDPVRAITTSPALTIPAQTLAVEALMAMLRRGIRHYPVVEDGRIVGMVSAGDLLRQRASSPLHLSKRIDDAADVGEVAAAAEDTGAVVAALLAAGAGGGAVSRVVAAVTDRIVQRLVALAHQELGPAPVPFAWLAFGSHGRQEQTLHTDQDTGLLLPAGADHAARSWAGALGGQVTDWLVTCGFPRCQGGVMASEPDWCRDAASWEQRFEHWLAAPGEQALLGAEIAFDVRTVAGDLDADALLRPVIARAAGAPLFLARLARQSARHRPPLGFLGRFTVERSGRHAGTFDVKAGAMLPIADIARLHTLARGGPERGTDERLTAAAASGQLSADLAATLRAGYELALRIRLEGQLERRREGEPMGNRVDPDALPPFERSHLKETFRAIRLAQEAIATAYRTDVLG